MTENLLRFEASPYLLQHKDNPVHWRPWGPAALAEAATANKPILLSIGYAACHWCHVMAHESFEDTTTAAVMNRLFVSIKVDREERPDIDQIYMAALHAIGEQGGWPLTMFLTPAGEPIWGGTYFPPTARYGRPAFRDIMEEVARLFREEPEKIATNRDFLLSRLNEKPEGEAVAVDRALLDLASDRLVGLMDSQNGGTKGAPKFPQASLLESLWRAGIRTGEPRYRDAVLLTLREISAGGIYDHIGGGFARYSTDARWLAPHFEKMLYDNAQLLELLTLAWLATGEAVFQERVAETIDWLEREMLLSGGAFAASLDADSEGHEGRFYVWTRAEVIDVLGAEEGAFFADAYDIVDGGNWEGVSIPNRLGRGAIPDADATRLCGSRAKLLARRATRIRPATDDKVLADWNGLMIAALALAGASFGRADWIALAERAFNFVAGTMGEGGRLAHSWREGKAVSGLASDYAAMIKAALALHGATFDDAWLTRAEVFAARVAGAPLGRRGARIFPFRRRRAGFDRAAARDDRRSHAGGNVTDGAEPGSAVASHRKRCLPRRRRRHPRIVRRGDRRQPVRDDWTAQRARPSAGGRRRRDRAARRSRRRRAHRCSALALVAQRCAVGA